MALSELVFPCWQNHGAKLDIALWLADLRAGADSITTTSPNKAHGYATVLVIQSWKQSLSEPLTSGTESEESSHSDWIENSPRRTLFWHAPEVIPFVGWRNWSSIVNVLRPFSLKNKNEITIKKCISLQWKTGVRDNNENYGKFFCLFLECVFPFLFAGLWLKSVCANSYSSAWIELISCSKNTRLSFLGN